MTSSLSSHGEQKFTPQPLLDMNYAFARTALLVAAVRLHLSTHLSKKAFPNMAYHTTLAQYSVERDCVTVDLVPNAMHLDRIQRAASGHVTVKEGAV